MAKKYLILAKLFLTAYILLESNFTAVAQDETPSSNKTHISMQQHRPIGFDNYQWATYYYNGRYTYNLKGFIASETYGDVEFLKVNPSGTSYALLSRKKENSKVAIYDLWKAENKLGEIKKVKNASSIVYTPDARKLVVATSTGILIYDARTYVAIDRIESPITASQVAVSPNNYYLAATDGTRLIIWNMESKSIRKEIELNATVNDIAFSDDSKFFAVLTANGKLDIYNTQDLLINNTYDAMGDAIDCVFHPDGKYIAVACSDNRIALVNMLDNTNRNYIDDERGGISSIHFLKDNNEQVYLLYNAINGIVYRRITELAPNYTKLLADELDVMMTEWMKQMPEESLEEYRLRVNDDTRMEQMRVFEQEIATRLADNLVLMSEVTLGNYNLESNMLTVNFDNMPTIFLEVPSEDVNGFMNIDDLEFNNAKYGLTSKDKFELIYVDIRNKATGKIYTYNNLARRSLEYLKLDKAFVPLDVIQQSNLQEMKLQEIKETVVSMAKEQNTISDHTNITVRANVESSTNADGEKIMNYVTSFSYTVEKEFSAKEDFAPGKYKSEESGAAKSMLQIVKQALEGEFAQYVKSGKKLLVKITGMADAMPINGTIAYDGCYGDYVGEPVYKNKILGNITLVKAEGIKENEQLAFVRALGVKDYLTKNITGITTMDTDYNYNIEVTSGKGGEFRRITVQLIFVDAF